MTRICLLVLGMALTLTAFADEGSDFVGAFATAVNTKDRKAWEAFLSPGSRACLSGPAKEILDQIFVKDTSQRVAPDSKVHVTALSSTEVLMFEEMLTYPDRPTHYFQIDLGPPGKMTGALVRYGRLQGGKWQYVVGCPKPAAIAEYGKTRKTSIGGGVRKGAAESTKESSPARRSRAHMDASECLKQQDMSAVMRCAEAFR